MGVELHITRTPQGVDAPREIAAEEWLAYISKDPELKPWPENGPHFVRWLGKSAHADPWLDWSHGEISSQWPDTALYLKMLQIAVSLGARVRDDDDKTYSSPEQWQFAPSSEPPPQLLARKPWWRFW